MSQELSCDTEQYRLHQSKGVNQEGEDTWEQNTRTLTRGGRTHAQGGDEDICQDKSRTAHLESGWARLG